MKYFVFIFGIILFGCSTGDGKKGPTDNATSGKIKISVDESLKPIIDAEIKAFEGIYTNASITPIYVPEAEAIRLLILDSVRLAVITRVLNADEKEQIRKQKYESYEARVAHEGIALVVNPANPDTVWDMTRLKNALSDGKSDQKFVFDHQNSGISRFVTDSLLNGAPLSANTYAAGTSEGVIDYISKDKKAVGLIGVSWISDSDDSVANRFLGAISVVGLKKEGQNEYYKPYQAYIAQKLYPLTRDIVINIREGRAGLGTGFTSFVAGEKGQRVILKAGLVPATMPIRLVQIRREPL
ncbi:MAG: substrate-binding domain-containing protein [Bacteroidota bacterium]